MEKDIGELKKEIRGRDEAVAEKERKIGDLKRSGIELDKNRFVLEHKIEDLQRQIRPKDEAIVDLRSQIEEMEEELNAVSRVQADLQQQMREAKGRASSGAAELAAERKKAGKAAVFHSRVQKDISDLVGLAMVQQVEAKQLRESVAKLGKKYNVDNNQHGNNANGSSFTDQDGRMDNEEERRNADLAVQEILRQKSFLEGTVTSLREQMKKQVANQKREYNRKVRENSFLIQEIEALKKELKQVRGYKLPKKLLKAQSTSTNEDF